jgi:hypothetical protein
MFLRLYLQYYAITYRTNSDETASPRAHPSNTDTGARALKVLGLSLTSENRIPLVRDLLGALASATVIRATDTRLPSPLIPISGLAVLRRRMGAHCHSAVSMWAPTACAGPAKALEFSISRVRGMASENSGVRTWLSCACRLFGGACRRDGVCSSLSSLTLVSTFVEGRDASQVRH